ncbi:MAG TPA: hypothetical protein PLH09_10855, partial [Lentimicrobium sp.]|nr:hypothetical protein [Lentimicrobium sp.]
MKQIKQILFFASLLMMASCNDKTKTESVASPPEWSKEVIWYQIFVERFNNGDPSNDPTIASISTPSASFPVPDDWAVSPWTSDWYTQEPWAAKTG